MTKKTAMLLVGAVLIVSVLASGCSFNIGGTSKTYTSPHGYTIKFSSAWGDPEEKDNGKRVIFLTPADEENEFVQVEARSWNGTLADLTEALKSDAQTNDDFKGIEATDTTLSGLPAYKLVFTGTDDAGQFKVLYAFTVKNGKGYLITYRSTPSDYDKYLGQAQEMINSFQIT